MSDHKSASGHTSEHASTQTPEHISEHISSVGSSVAIWLALLAGTGLTVAAAFIDLGPFNTVVALTIATIKATLVVLFFMHVVHSPRLTWVVIIASFLWLSLLFVLTFADYFTRGWSVY